MATVAENKFNYKIHPLGELFPEMPPDEFKKLKNDIELHGQQEPIVVSEDGLVLLDGRHRLRACRELGIEPRVERFNKHTGGTRQSSESDFIWSMNVLRRHLKDDQRAAIGHKWADAEREAAKERQKQHGGTAPGKPKGNTFGESAKSVHTREAIAKKAHVSEHKVRQVETVAKHAPELLPKVESGQMTLKDAEKEAKAQTAERTEKADSASRIPPAFDERATLKDLRDDWEWSVKKNWPANRDLTPVIRNVYAFATHLDGLQRVRAAKLREKVQAVGVQVGAS